METKVGVPPHFIVIVPGIMGSKLKLKHTGELIWGDPFKVLWHAQRRVPNILHRVRPNKVLDEWLAKLKYSPSNALEPVGIVDRVVFVPPWAKLNKYTRLLRLLEKMGYSVNAEKEEDRNVYEFAYDWRQDNRESAKQLGERIRHWQSFHPGAKAWIIAHSNGGLVASWYISRLDGDKYVGKLIMMGSPLEGAFSAMQMVMKGLENLIARYLGMGLNIPDRTREVFRTFPSSYQLLPTNVSLTDIGSSESIDPYGEANLEYWLHNEGERNLFDSGHRFKSDLRSSLHTMVHHVETVCCYGGTQLTPFGADLTRGALGRWMEFDPRPARNGDGTVPQYSATILWADPPTRHYHSNANHGNIYANKEALGYLKLELQDRYLVGDANAPTATRPQLEIVTGRDTYTPGEEVIVEANAWKNPPISDADVQVSWELIEPLPGFEQIEPSEELPTTILRETSWDKRGTYLGSVAAPTHPGYYELRVTVHAEGEAEAVSEEILSVQHPDYTGILDQLINRESAAQKERAAQRARERKAQEEARRRRVLQAEEEERAAQRVRERKAQEEARRRRVQEEARRRRVLQAKEEERAAPGLADW